MPVTRKQKTCGHPRPVFGRSLKVLFACLPSQYATFTAVLEPKFVAGQKLLV